MMTSNCGKSLPKRQPLRDAVVGLVRVEERQPGGLPGRLPVDGVPDGAMSKAPMCLGAPRASP
eukprot:6999175-Heterocapsa_arctica.AAC.1